MTLFLFHNYDKKIKKKEEAEQQQEITNVIISSGIGFMIRAICEPILK